MPKDLNPFKYPDRPRKGFSLLEVLVAAAIFAFAMAGIIQMFMKCSLLDQTNRNKGIATAHAELVMESIVEYMRVHSISDLSSSNNLGTWNQNTNPTIGTKLGCAAAVYPCVLNNETITTTYTADPEPVDHPPVITVTVTWQDRAQANSRSLVLKTFAARR